MNQYEVTGSACRIQSEYRVMYFLLSLHVILLLNIIFLACNVDGSVKCFNQLGETDGATTKTTGQSS